MLAVTLVFRLPMSVAFCVTRVSRPAIAVVFDDTFVFVVFNWSPVTASVLPAASEPAFRFVIVVPLVRRPA